MKLRLSNLGLMLSVSVVWMTLDERRLAAQGEPVETIVVERGVEWTYFKGTEEPDPDWMKLGFDDTSWDVGPSPFGYGDTTEGTMLDDMSGNYMSVYLRHLFDFRVEPGELLAMSVAYDDGFVAYFNGVEFYRAGLQGTPPPFDAAATSHEVNNPPQQIFFSCEEMAFVESGDNVLAIQAHNTDLGSSDLVMDVELKVVTFESLCPELRDCEERSNGIRVRWRRPATGIEYDSIEVRRNGVVLEKQPSSPRAQSYTDNDPLPGTNNYEVKVTCGELECTVECSVTIGGDGPVFRRGDADASGSVNISDAVVILGALFQGQDQPSCGDAADTNDDGSINLTDGVFLLGSLFQGTDQPPAPGVDTCGADPSEDSLPECVYGAACN